MTLRLREVVRHFPCEPQITDCVCTRKAAELAVSGAP